MRRTSVLALGFAVLLAVAPLAPGEPVAGPAIVLTERQGQAAPVRSGCTYVGGGTFDVKQSSADTVVITMVGAVVATAHPCGSSASLDFDFDQGFEIVAGSGRGNAKLSLEIQAVGVLRGGRIAAAATNAAATVAAGAEEVVAGALPARAVACGENLAVNDRVAPDGVPIGPGAYVLHAFWRLSATHPKSLRGKAASAEFAPEPALDPIWVGGPRDPFHGVAKKDFGLRITLHVDPAPTSSDAGTAAFPVEWRAAVERRPGLALSGR